MLHDAAAAPGTTIELLVRERNEPADFPVICRTGLALLGALRDLPQAEAGALMRFLMSPAP